MLQYLYIIPLGDGDVHTYTYLNFYLTEGSVLVEISGVDCIGLTRQKQSILVWNKLFDQLINLDTVIYSRV